MNEQVNVDASKEILRFSSMCLRTAKNWIIEAIYVRDMSTQDHRFNEILQIELEGMYINFG